MREGKILGMPDIMWLPPLLAVVVSILVRRTAFGCRLVAIGDNLRASLLAGPAGKRTLIIVYALSGTFAAMAGVIATARLRAS